MLPQSCRKKKHNQRRMRKIMCYSSKFKENGGGGGVVKKYITLPYVHIINIHNNDNTRILFGNH